MCDEPFDIMLEEIHKVETGFRVIILPEPEFDWLWQLAPAPFPACNDSARTCSRR